ncbi:DUF3180 family protein [Gulosibacter macacae]|uniref:DUF3180 family protein n=1 Tax=Gulosibacter macacae TaxID=2488791 RepID=UPI0016398989|nr:DUF3180 family protein [Gulosibacter macacae]
MKYTNPFVLVLSAIAGGAVAVAFETWLISSGQPLFLLSPVFSGTLLATAIVTLAIAWPVRRYTAAMRRVRELRRRESALDPDALDAAARAASGKRVNPERAVFALALAKASALGGAVFLGAAIGIAGMIVTRPGGFFGIEQTLLAGGCALVLLVAGLLAEFWCVLPPEDGDAEQTSNGERAAV